MTTKCLVIGSNGLIGSSISKELKKYYSVDCYAKHIDYHNPLTISTSYDIIVIAAFVGINVYQSYRSCKENILLNRSIIKAISNQANSNSRIYIIGSNSEFKYLSAEKKAIEDSKPGEPHDMFTLSKQLIYDAYREQFQDNVYYCKPFFVYSEDSTKGLFQYVRKSILSDDPIISINTALSVADWIHSVDVGRAIVHHIINNSSVKSFNIGSQYDKNIFELISRSVPALINRFSFNQLTPVSYYMSDNTELRRLGYLPSVDVEEWLNSFLTI
jgi:nucleoside-diphosphate-sugar epimerase